MGLFSKLFGKSSKRGKSTIITSPKPAADELDYTTVLADILNEPEAPSTTLSDIIPETLESTPQRKDPEIQEAARSAMLKEKKRKGRGATILNTAPGLEDSPLSLQRPGLRQASLLGQVG